MRSCMRTAEAVESGYLLVRMRSHHDRLREYLLRGGNDMLRDCVLCAGTVVLQRGV